MTISRLLICLLISFGLSAPAFAQTPPDFSAWVEAFKREARAEGISDAVLDDAFANVHAPEPKIIKNDHTQPEQTRSFAAYANAVVTPKKSPKRRLSGRRIRRFFTASRTRTACLRLISWRFGALRVISASIKGRFPSFRL